MTLIPQNTAMNNTSVSKSGTTSGKSSNGTVVNATDGTTPVVEQSFSLFMEGGGSTSANATLLNGAILLEGLLQNASLQDSQVVEGDTLSQLMDGLNEELTKLDDVITEDPELMVILQGWLQQVNALLSSNGTGSQNSDVVEPSVSSVLAEHPATIRFALQDGLGQLAALLKNSEGASTSSQVDQLLASFQNVLQEAGVDDKQSTISQNKSQVVSNLSNVPSSNLIQGDPSTRMLQESVLIPSNQATASVLDEGTTRIQDDVVSSDQGTITAGELLMREGIKNPMKAAAPVPVEQFAKEMTNFVVSKLDIIKHNGLTEAKISLYPEHLGQVDIKITMVNGQLIASFMTEHAGAKDLLEQQMSQLRTALQSQGLQVERLEVTQNQSLQSHMYQDGRQQSSAGQQQSNRKSKETEGTSDDALVVAELTEEWNEWISEHDESDRSNTFTAKA